MYIENISCENECLWINPDYLDRNRIKCDFKVCIKPTVSFIEETKRKINLLVLINLITKEDKTEALNTQFNGIIIATILPKSKKETVDLEHIKEAILSILRDADEFLSDSNNVPSQIFSLGYESILHAPLENVTKQIYDSLTMPPS